MAYRATLTNRLNPSCQAEPNKMSRMGLPTVHQWSAGSPMVSLRPTPLPDFMNDLPEHIQSKVRMFSDNCTVYREINNKSDCEILQEDLHALERWESTWAMEFHPAKCSVMRVATSRDPLMLSYKLKGHQLQTETTSKYLGVDLGKNLDWKPHVDRIVKKSNSMLGFLRCNLRISSDKLNQLQWDTLKVRRCKLQLARFYKVVNNIVDIDKDLYLTSETAKQEPATPRNSGKSPLRIIASLELSHSRINSQHLLPMPLTWYSSSRVYPTSYSKR